MLAYLQMRKRQTVHAGNLTRPLRLTPLQERELFRRLVRGGVIARARPGLFVVPPQLPLGGSWSPDEALALDALMQDRKGRYQICGRTPSTATASRSRCRPASTFTATGHDRGGLLDQRAKARWAHGKQGIDRKALPEANGPRGRKRNEPRRTR
jgi:hypothetical protein